MSRHIRNRLLTPEIVPSIVCVYWSGMYYWERLGKLVSCLPVTFTLVYTLEGRISFPFYLNKMFITCCTF